MIVKFHQRKHIFRNGASNAIVPANTKNQQILNGKREKNKKNPQDSGESWGNLMAEDEGFEFADIIP